MLVYTSSWLWRECWFWRKPFTKMIVVGICTWDVHPVAILIIHQKAVLIGPTIGFTHLELGIFNVISWGLPDPASLLVDVLTTKPSRSVLGLKVTININIIEVQLVNDNKWKLSIYWIEPNKAKVTQILHKLLYAGSSNKITWRQLESF